MLAAASILAVSCEKNETVPAAGSRTVTVSAALGDMTKVGTGSAVGKFAWEQGDVIGIFTGAGFTPFSLDAASVGQVAGTFTGTLPEGGAIGENSIAVYPYTESLAIDGATLTVDGLMGNVPLLAKAAGVTTSGSTTVASYKFGLTTALVRLVINNIPAEANFVFIESTKKIFATDGTIDISAEYPKLTASGADWQFIALPEHSAAISRFELYVPIIPGEWGDPTFRFTLFTADNWNSEMAKDPYNHRSNIVTGGYINRGDLFNLPEVTF